MSSSGSDSEPELGQLTSTSTSDAKDHFETNNNSMTVLLSMAIGLEDPQTEGKIISDISSDERFPQKKKKQWNPSLKDLVAEIKRRKVQMGDSSKTNYQMRKKDALTFLVTNPITNKEDKRFVLERLTQFINDVDAAKKEKSSGDTTATQHWTGVVPFL